MAQKQCWALPQTGPQVRKSANCGLKVLVCGFANRFFTANICGKKIEIYRKSTASLRSFLQFQKKTKTFIQFNVSTDLGGYISNVQHPLTKFLCCGTIISQRCYYSYSKMSWLKVKKLPTACFSEGKFRLFEMAKGCTRRL